MSSTDVHVVPTYRLSVIIPFDSRLPGGRRGLAERALLSVLRQPDPVGTEVILAEDGLREDTFDYFRQAFGDEVAQGRVQIPELPRRFNLGATIQGAAEHARGTFLAVLDPEDRWRPERLRELEPLLRGHDLLLESDAGSSPGQASEWLARFIRENPGVRSSAVVRRTLFDEIGGYPAGGLLTRADYAWWLRAVTRLVESGRRDRIWLGRNTTVERGGFDLPGPLAALQGTVDQVRDAVTLLAQGRRLPVRYWPAVGRRLRDVGREIWRRRR